MTIIHYNSKCNSTTTTLVSALERPFPAFHTVVVKFKTEEYSRLVFLNLSETEER